MTDLSPTGNRDGLCMSDLQSDASHLAHLLDTVVDHAGSDQRTNALTWIARDLAESLRDRLQRRAEAGQ